MSGDDGQRVIVLTGATRGLGLAAVKKFIELGHIICGCGRSGPDIDDLTKTFGDPHQFHAVDVTDHASVKDWAELIVAKHGPPDLLINNAAMINQTAPLWDVPQEEFDKVIDVNIKGVANVIRAFVPAMIDRGSGVIVNLSSGWGRSTSPHVAPYCATKFAIEGLTSALAQELPRGLAAVALNPGVIDTDMLRSCWADGAASYRKPDQWAESAVPFMLGLSASDNGGSLTAP